MSKKEIIWRQILFQATENKKIEFTQKELAREFGFSLSTIFNALKVLRQSGAIKVGGRNFKIIDLEKFLYFWATQRNLNKEIIYKTNFSNSPREAEGLMPDGVIFACYNAYTKKYNDAPADYDKVYVYANAAGLAEIKKRFPKQKGESNLFVLKKSGLLNASGHTAPDAQIFCELWNLSDWYAKEYLKKIKEKILTE